MRCNIKRIFGAGLGFFGIGIFTFLYGLPGLIDDGRTWYKWTTSLDLGIEVLLIVIGAILIC